METVKFSNTQYQKYPKLLFLLFDNLKCLVSTKHPRLGQATGFLFQKLCKGWKICWTFQLLLDLHLVHLAESVKMAISAIPPSLRSSKLWKFDSWGLGFLCLCSQYSKCCDKEWCLHSYINHSLNHSNTFNKFSKRKFMISNTIKAATPWLGALGSLTPRVFWRYAHVIALHRHVVEYPQELHPHPLCGCAPNSCRGEPPCWCQTHRVPRWLS